VSENPKIRAIHEEIQALVNRAQLTPEEAFNCLSELLAYTLLVICDTEKEAHEGLNSAEVSMHEYINNNWRTIEATKRGVLSRMMSRMLQ
jgi:hypothetical protein